MAGKFAVLFAGVVCVLCCFNQADASWQQSESDANVYLFYPGKMTYVDRIQPLTDVGTGASILKVGDEADNIPDTNGEYDFIHACRTYLMFSAGDFQEGLDGKQISSVALILKETGRDIDTIAAAPASEPINVRQVTGLGSGYSAAGYLNGLTWDGQSDRGITYGGIYSSCNFTADNDGGDKIWAGNLQQLVSGWMSGGIANYGMVLENDFDGIWSKITPGDPDSKYQIADATQMNELEAVFDRTSGNSPYIRVAVSPSTVVPEPTGGALTLLGFGVLALFRKKKKS